jgi:hypothetical protein
MQDAEIMPYFQVLDTKDTFLPIDFDDFQNLRYMHPGVYIKNSEGKNEFLDARAFKSCTIEDFKGNEKVF